MLLRYITVLFLILLGAKLNVCQTTAPFYSQQQAEIPFLNRVQFAEYKNGNNDDLMNGVDARNIIGPLMSPFMDMFDVMQQNAKARSYADKVAQDREDSPLSSSSSIFEMIERLQRPTTTTTPQPPLIERLIRPYLEPWQKQFKDFSKDLNGFLPSTTESPMVTTTTKENLFEKSLKMFFPSFQQSEGTTTTHAPKLFDASMIEKLFFSRQKRDLRLRRKRQLESQPMLDSILLNPLKELEKPILDLANPFTPNPLMSLFTTPKTLPELPKMDRSKHVDMPFPMPTLTEPQYKLQDPFYNPFFPNRKSKLFDLLAGGDASRIIGK